MKYSVKAAAIATGVSESRLRTWERRYGVPKPARSGSGRRQYDESDIDVIRRMAALVDAGISASSAAAAALTEETSVPIPTAPEVNPAAARLAEAGTHFAEDEASRILEDAVATLGWEKALDDVFLSAMQLVGESWHDNTIASANEHFMTELVRSRIFREVSLTGVASRDAPSIVLACPEDERHDVGLLGLSLLLRRKGLRTYYLGADVPAADLLQALIQTKADALCLAVTLPHAAANAARAVRELIAARVSAKIFIGGPAISGDRTSTVAGIVLPSRLGDAARVIAEAIH